MTNKPGSFRSRLLEYVDDSEPEREERRRMRTIAKAKLRRGQRQAPQSFNAASKFQPESSSHVNWCAQVDPTSSLEMPVFETSGKAVALLKVPSIYADHNLERSDDINSNPKSLSPPSSSSTSSSSLQVQHIHEPMVSSVDPYSSGSISSPVHALFPLEDSEDPDHAFQLKLRRFAYAPSVHPTKPARSRPISLPSVPAVPSPYTPASPVKKRRTSRMRLLPDIPDSKLAALLKCPSCEIAWTIRKTGRNKLTHILTCARKKGHTTESLQSLVQRGLIMCLTKPETTPTSTNEVTKDAGLKTRCRLPEVEVTIKGPSQTRIGILSRARSLLGGIHTPASESTQAPAQAERVQPSPTQPFGDSALLQRFLTARSDGGPLPIRDDKDVDFPPRGPLPIVDWNM
ncbi:hypothetical protein BV25DRAFT_1842455 [Artomyces pyxidatus]|uniref:Uncharacterized protein n=1 Tax=Artomyces pyxidatus TaxID=48021 RepID=A0ACB8SIG0_9AGAM|nr:hypothetical protein BV25DRAFT_1842455 [Artomyces pyxidatus]